MSGVRYADTGRCCCCCLGAGERQLTAASRRPSARADKSYTRPTDRPPGHHHHHHHTPAESNQVRRGYDLSSAAAGSVWLTHSCQFPGPSDS